MNMSGYVEALRERGYYCLPSHGYKNKDQFKQPKCKGGFYGNILANPSVFDRYANDGWNRTAISIWCGTFLAIDCDGFEGTNDFIQLMKRLNVPIDVERAYTVKTPRNGYHFYYLAPDNLAIIKNKPRLKGLKIDVRTCRGYVVCPGVQRPIEDGIRIYTPNERFLGSDGLLIPAYQLPECPQPLLDILPVDDSVSERQLKLLSLLPEPYRYIYEYAKNYKSTSIAIDVNDVKADPYYYPTSKEIKRVIGKAKYIENSDDCDMYGRTVEGHSKTMKIISFVLRDIADGDINRARAVIDEWNSRLDWAWSEDELDRMFVKVAKTSKNVNLMWEKV